MADKANGQQGAISKMEAVRRALGDLGKDAKPAALQPYIKDKFGLDMTPEHITTCKGSILKASRKGKGKGKGKAAAAKPTPADAPVAKAATKAESAKVAGISLPDIQKVKELVGRVGADSLRTLIDVLAR